MTPLYAGIGGVVRELTEMHTGINGVVTPMTEMWAGVGGVNRQIFSAGTPVGNLSVGDIVQLNENGVAQDYLCVHQGLPSSMYDSSCDGTWLLRRTIIERRAWDAEDITAYGSSDMNIWLNSSMLEMYDENIQSGIKQVKIPYVNGPGGSEVASGVDGLDCKVFLLSGYEVGWTQSDNSAFPEDGSKLSYFESGTGDSANNRRNEGMTPKLQWWLRSPESQHKEYVWQVKSEGTYNYRIPSYDLSIRPCIILPQDFVL